jgi:hypothetical protein
MPYAGQPEKFEEFRSWDNPDLGKAANGEWEGEL